MILFAYRRRRQATARVLRGLSWTTGIVALALYQLSSVLSGLRLIIPSATFPVLLVGVPLLVLGALRLPALGKLPAVTRLSRGLRQPRSQLLLALGVGVIAWASILTETAERHWQGDLRGFPRFDERRPHDAELLQSLPLHVWGHDGQFYAILATDPLLLEGSTEEAIDVPAYRGRRIALPLLAALLSGFGRGDAVVAYVLLSWLGTLAAVTLAGYGLLRLGGPPAWALLLFFQAGVVFSTSRALIDTTATAFVLLALLLWENNRPAGSALAATAAALTKEGTLLLAPALALDAWRQGRRRQAALVFLLPTVSLTAWTFYLRASVRWSPVTGDNFGWPLAWLPQKIAIAPEYSWSGWLLLAEIASIAAVLIGFVFAARLLLVLWRARQWPSATDSTLLAVTAMALVLNLKVYRSVADFPRALLLMPFLVLWVAAGHSDAWLRRLAAVIVLTGAIAGFAFLQVGL